LPSGDDRRRTEPENIKYRNPEEALRRGRDEDEGALNVYVPGLSPCQFAPEKGPPDMSQASVASNDLTTDEEGVRALLVGLASAWAANDGTAFAELFSADGSVVLPGDIYLKNKEHIRGFMTAAYQGPYKGTNVVGTALDIRFIDAATSVMITEGGVLAPGETEVAPERAIRATWVSVKQDDGEWKLAAYHNSPINVPA
jgi:uncharacterized protein (TIGR02246 family)